MAAYFAQGRLGTEIANLPLDGLWMIVEHSPCGDHWMKGGSLVALIERIADLEGQPISIIDAKVRCMMAKKSVEYAQQMENVWDSFGMMGCYLAIDLLENGGGDWL